MADDYKPVIDQFGNPISRADIALLKSEIAAPSSFSVRAPFVGNIGFDIEPRRLGAIIRAADNGSTRDWFILAEQIEELFTHCLLYTSRCV